VERGRSGEALFGAFISLSEAQNDEDAASRFLDALKTVFGFERCLLYLSVSGGSMMKPHTAVPENGKPDTPPVDRGSRFARMLSGADGPVHIDEFFNDAGEASREEMNLHETFVNLGFSYACPLSIRRELEGILIFGGGAAALGPDDGKLLGMICGAAALEVRNMRSRREAVSSRLDMEKFSKFKRELIEGISKDIMTPLSVLKSTLCSIEPDGIEGDVMISMAKDSVRSLESMVQKLASLNEIEPGRAELRNDRVDVSSLLEDCLREMIPEFEEKRITVRVDDGAGNRDVIGDADKIKIAIRCIIDNAVRYTGRGGNISVKTLISESGPRGDEGVEIEDWQSASGRDEEESIPDPIRSLLSGSRPGAVEEFLDREGMASHLVIRVSDDGIGIPRDEIGGLSEPFRRASNTPVEYIKGAGVGVTISQKIIRDHGGRMFCRSAPGDGSEFSIWLPSNGS